MNILHLLRELTLNEKAALVAGTNFMYTNPIPRLNIPSLRMSDGPHGLRVQQDSKDNGVTGSEVATAFPTAATIASSWNLDNAFLMGQAIGEECLHYGVDVLLGPGVCIKRNPLCGRNFEYFSEDPFLAGKMGASEVKGIQSKNIAASVKHFALNNAENYRFMGDSVCDLRAIREIYLKPFEMIVKESEPRTLMCAYNKINGVYCSQNKWLLKDVLRNEWGFNGLVMSDWGATHDRVNGVIAGLDLEMPGDTDICRKWIIDSVNNGTLSEKDLDNAVINILSLINLLKDNQKNIGVNREEHNRLANKIAEDSAILLKNDGTLPLNKNDKFLIIGDLFQKMRYQGSGSSMINPKFLVTPKDAFDKNNVNYEFVRGYNENELTLDESLLNEALKKAIDFDKILIFAGLTDYAESEGSDRDSMELPLNQLTLINALSKQNKKIVLILYGGSSMELPFENNINSILDMYLPGQSGGLATYNLLFGLKNPSGKLAETWVKEYKDVPFGGEFSKKCAEIYKESIFVGYRYYVSKDKEVRYPFGFGLSYTKFKISNMELLEKDNLFKVSCDVQNIGNYDGSEVIEVYIKGPNGVFKPLRELKGFQKVYLKVNEKKRVTITINKDELKYWNAKENRFVLESGEYIFEICKDASTSLIQQKITIEGEKVDHPYGDLTNELYSKSDLTKISDSDFEKMSNLKIPIEKAVKPINLESRFTDLKETFLGNILFKSVLSVAKNDMKKAKKLPEGTERDNKIKGALFLKRILESNSIITMSMSAGRNFPYTFAQGFVNLSNGHIFKGVKCFCTKIKVPKLPKDEEVK